VRIPLADREIIDDTDEKRTLREVTEAIEDRKRLRKDVRDENFRILQEDARNAMELRAQQVKMCFHA
jgi:hypothetical protein